MILSAWCVVQNLQLRVRNYVIKYKVLHKTFVLMNSTFWSCYPVFILLFDKSNLKPDNFARKKDQSYWTFMIFLRWEEISLWNEFCFYQYECHKYETEFLWQIKSDIQKRYLKPGCCQRSMNSNRIWNWTISGGRGEKSKVKYFLVIDFSILLFVQCFDIHPAICKLYLCSYTL